MNKQNTASRELPLAIEGMTCSGCAVRLEESLRGTPGVRDAVVNLSLERAAVVIDDESTDLDHVIKAVREAGFEVGREVLKFVVTGMTCSACAQRVEETLLNTAGVIRADVNLVLERASVTIAARVTDEEQLVNAVNLAGYGLVSVAQENVDQSEVKLRRDRRDVIAASLLTLPLVAQMLLQFMGYNELHLLPAIEVLLATPIQFVLGLRFYRAALNALRSRSTNMDVLVVLGTTAAYVYSWYLLITLGEEAEGQLFFEASAVVITLVLLGKYLEAKAKRATSEAVRALMSLRPETALVKTAMGVLEERPIAEVRVGDVVVCRPGDRVAVDGRVVQGEAEVDESLITGESVPQLKSQGDSVTGGSININGVLEIETLTVGDDSTLQTIVRLVESAQLGKTRVQNLVDRITVWFVPLVLILAGITLAGRFLLYGDLEVALLAAVSVLVIACPCALGLATPTAIMTGTGAAARAGILIRDVSTLEEAQVLKRIVFDKTGTLTLGQPRVRQVTALAGSDERGVIEIAAAIQQNSEHPLAKALCTAAEEQGISTRPSDGFVNRVGQGVEGQVAGTHYLCGNDAMLREAGLIVPSIQDLNETDTKVWLADSTQVLGAFSIYDALRAEAAEAVEQLLGMDIEPVIVSGDAQAVVQSVADEVGIVEAYGGVSPEGKAQMLSDWIEQGISVGMVGDGVNDSPALAVASVGFAMGSGTDVAMETAAITLMRSDPRLVPGAIDASQRTFRKIKQNLFWAFVYNIVAMPLAMAGALTPTIAGAAMALSSVSVVANSLLLRSWRPNV